MVSVAVPGDGAKVAAGTFDRVRVVHLTGGESVDCHPLSHRSGEARDGLLCRGCGLAWSSDGLHLLRVDPVAWQLDFQPSDQSEATRRGLCRLVRENWRVGDAL